MIIETIFAWFMSIVQFGFSFLPKSDSTLQAFRNVDLTILKSFTVLNGYLPLTELLPFVTIAISFAAFWYGLRAATTVLTLITKFKP
jgi:hypothetical protein